MSKKSAVILVVLISFLALFLQLYKWESVPACLNSDEAAYGYNAYSLAQTGRDEYGALIPLRLKSFGDYKLPLYSYLSVPFVGLFGTTDMSIRLLNIVLAVALVPLVFFLTNELFGKRELAAAAALLTALNPAHYILSRHAHEGVLSVFLLLAGVLFLIKWRRSPTAQNFVLANISLLLCTFAYHSGRIFLLLLILYQFIILWKRKNKARYILILLVILVIPFSVDILYGANRVTNLLFTSDIGFQLRVNDALSHHPNRIIHNKLTHAVKEVGDRYARHFSPEFLTINGDTNPRFGMSGLGIVTVSEYLLFLVGLYYLFKNQQKYRYLLFLLLLTAPLSNALTWQDPSLNRTYPLLFFIIITAAYGGYGLFKERDLLVKGIASGLIVLYIFALVSHWDLYLYHFAKRSNVPLDTSQCGYKELSRYIQANYRSFDKFVITRRHGQPYIFLLYYLGYDPASYQRQANLSSPDQYGYGQIVKFDEFDFDFKYDPQANSTVFIGYPADFSGTGISEKDVKKISVSNQDIFWIVEKK